ncbi:MAG: CapA family protein [Patescibacteria group bacterium]
MRNKLAILPFFLVVLPLILYIVFIQFEHWSTITIPSSSVGVITTDAAEKPDELVTLKPLTFVGDVLLARNVEFLMKTRGVGYPFKNVPELLGADNVAVIGNFESAILEQHRQTPSYVTTFSVDKNLLPTLSQADFTHMSLANNHSFDYGSTTFSFTRQSLELAGITPFGHPSVVDGLSTVIIPNGTVTIGVLALNRVFTPITPEQITISLQALASTTDFQVVYIHWGEEYMLKHSATQESYARQFIDAGADAIIGHHPHVVQDIDVYNGAPIFYSLGNFIFDQYFSVDVEQGLVVKLSFLAESVQYELVPVSSENSHSQPALMAEAERALFLANLARRSNPLYKENIKSGKLILPFSLATYP